MRVVVQHGALADVSLEVRLGALVDALVEVALGGIQLELVGADGELGELQVGSPLVFGAPQHGRVEHLVDWSEAEGLDKGRVHVTQC